MATSISFSHYCQTGDVEAFRRAVETAPGGGRKSAVVRKAITGDDYAMFRTAAANGHSDVVLFLIELYGGRDHPRAERARQTNSHAALSLACRAGHAAVVRVLIEAYGGWGAPALTQALVNSGALLWASDNVETMFAICSVASAPTPTPTPTEHLPALLRRVRARKNTDVAARALAWPEAWATGVAQCLTTHAFREEHARPTWRWLLQAAPVGVVDAMMAYYDRVPWQLYSGQTDYLVRD